MFFFVTVFFFTLYCANELATHLCYVTKWMAKKAAISVWFMLQQGIDITKDPMAMQRLREASEKAKIELSSSLQVGRYRHF